MGRLYNLVDQGRLQSGEAGRRVWMLSLIVKAIEVDEIEARMQVFKLEMLELAEAQRRIR